MSLESAAEIIQTGKAKLRYAYEDLSEDQFEHLVVVVCTILLGSSVQPFAKGKDGGKDARFEGTAELHPSVSAPWVGKTIIQAKHTVGLNRHFSDPDFFNLNTGSSTVTDELPKIDKLRKAKELDHYMLFANRKLTAGAEQSIRTHISKACNLKTESIYLVGTQKLEIYLKFYPQIAVIAALDPIESRLIVDVDDLSSVIEALSEQKKSFADVKDDPPTERIPYQTRNLTNNMSAEYASAIRRKYLSETPQVRSFLAHPDNLYLLRIYEDVADEFELKIVAKRKEYQSFDDVMNYLMSLLFARDPVLNSHKRLTRLMLFYMYWNCDMGSMTDASTN